MMTAAQNPKSDGKARKSPLIGPDEAEMEELFDLAAASFDFPGKAVLAKLEAGETLATAAGFPKAFLELLYGRAHRWARAGNVQRAEQIFRTLCIAAPTVPDYWGGLVSCLVHRGECGQALFALDQVLTLRPDWAAMHFYRLEALIHLKDWARASDQSRLVDDRTADLPKDLVGRAAKYKALIAGHLDS